MTGGAPGPSGSGDLIADGVESAVRARLARIDERFEQVRNMIADLEARLPALGREVDALRAEMDPTTKEEHDG